MDDCIFCMIARGEVPARVVYEDDVLIAFDDIAAQAPVHTLIIPKEHYRNLSDPIPATVLAQIFALVPRIAEMKGVTGSGYRVIVNNGLDSNQTVQHLHVHVLGGKRMTHGMVDFDE